MTNPKVRSAWSPLQYQAFKTLWIASLVSNIGTWLHNTGASWLMTELTPSPTVVALLQTATSLPIVLLALPAGSLADVVDRRTMLLWTQVWMLIVAVSLAVSDLMGLIDAPLLLGFTFALGIGNALHRPVWQAVIPELIPREELSNAIALGGVSINLARAVGPALGGIIVASAGVSAVFLLNAVSFGGMIIAIYRWQESPRQNSYLPEQIIGAMITGVRYVRYAPELKAVLIRAAAFIFCGTAFWALLPIVARQELKLDALGYGMITGAVGIGALIGATILPKIRQRWSLNALVAIATLIYAGGMLALAYLRSVPLLLVLSLFVGVAWITLMSSFNLAAQVVLPAWVRARGLAAYLIAFQGGMAAGGLVWGAVASRTGTSEAIAIAAVGLILGLALSLRYQLSEDNLDLSPSLHWSEPTVAMALRPDDGPVLITVRYQIKPETKTEFIRATKKLEYIRRRDGAYHWQLYSDIAHPHCYFETFVSYSWIEHLRQHDRFTITDRAIEERVRSFHVGEKPPSVSHLLAISDSK